jgi:hypothetical protein
MMKPITLTPYRVDGSGMCLEILGKNGTQIARVYSFQDDAEYMVHAANCHEELLEALKIVATDPGIREEAAPEWMAVIDAAIFKAEGKP